MWKLSRHPGPKLPPLQSQVNMQLYWRSVSSVQQCMLF